MVVHTPPMGFNTWNTFGKDINETMICEIADAMVDTGLRDCGYNYLVIDDCWSEKQRNEKRELVPSKEKFPNGMRAVADYVHSKGLKFGMYSCVGAMTCAKYPGSFRHEFQDARSFAEWGVDFLKYDYCYRSKSVTGAELYRKMGLALKNTGRDILYSACSWGHDQTEEWIDTTGANMWRATGDIKDSWQFIKDLALKSLELKGLNYINCFTDLDMLIVGMNGKGYCALTGCTVEEYITHFSFWSLFGSPLMIGCDIRQMDADTVRILTNREVIAINQDKEGNRPFILRGSEGMADSIEQPVAAKILENGDIAIGFFNFSDTSIFRYVTLDMLGLDADVNLKCTIKDLWSGQELQPENDMITAFVKPHECKLYRLCIEVE